MSYQKTFRSSEDTDLITWLKSNEPKNHRQLQELREVLYARRKVGAYESEDAGSTVMGEPKVRLKGPRSSVLILSEKARHFLLRNLCRLKRSV